MENVAKYINLECAKNRFYENHMPALDSDTLEPLSGGDCWGDFPYDVIIESGDTFDIFKLSNNFPILCECGHWVFRYGNIAHLYGWLKKIARETIFYKLGVRKDRLKWIEIEQDFFSGDTLTLVSVLPTVDSMDVCTIVGVHEEADLFNSYFRLDDDTRYEINFLNFVNDIFSGNSHYTFQKPYLDVSVMINEDVNSVGELLSDEQEWKANKKYYLGDIVHHEKKYYILDRGDKAEKIRVSGPLYDIVNEDFLSGQSIYKFISEIPENLDLLDHERINVLYTQTSSLTEFDFVEVYYKGHYDNDTKLTEFDEDNSHWIEIKTVCSGDTESGDTEIVVSSKLNAFRSIRKSYDNNNNELPFNVVESGDDKEVALIYTFGYTNYALKENGACVDFFNKVEFLRNLSDEEPEVIEYDGGEDKNIIISNLIDSGFTYARFRYYSGCEVIESGGTQIVDIENSGIKYTETRRIDIITDEIPYDSSAETEFTYFVLSESTEESKNLSTNKACASIKYETRTVDSVPLHVFSNSRLFGSTFVEHANDEVDISRGSYGAFERHNILGEINSMDDLENYRNNYFKL